MYEIERAYLEPFPTVPLRRGKWKSKYPFSQMGVGDSFFVPAVDANSSSVRAAASQYGLRRSVRFRCIAEADGIRVTRVE